MAGLPSINIDSIVNSVLKMDKDESDPSRDFDVAILVDESVSPEFISYARKAFTPVHGNAIMHVESYFDEAVEVSEIVDILIILANASPWTGACYAMASSRGITTIVMAEHLANVIRRSEEMQFPIDYANILAPEAIGMSVAPTNSFARKAMDVGTGIADTAIDVLGRKIPERVVGRPLVKEGLSTATLLRGKKAEGDEVYEKLFDQLADWVMANCEDFRSAFANAFAFAKPAEVDQITRRTAFQNAVTGAVFFIPGADFPVMTLNQLKMLVLIERSYGYGFDKQMLVEAGGVLAVALIARTVARSLCKRFPFLSWPIKTASGYFVTFIMGRAIRGHCENGRNLPPVIANRLKGFLSDGSPEITAVARIDD